MVEKVNLALFGAGYWGTKLAKEYIHLQQQNKKFNFFGIVDPDKAKLIDTGKKLNLESNILFDNAEECLRNPDINAIHIATPNETHFNIAQEALSNGKNVLLEKPMALTSRDAFKLARLAEKSGQILLVGHIFRFNSALQKAKEILETGQIGDINYLQLSWLDYLNPLPDRDIIFDLLPHPIDILNFLTGEWPSSIYTHSFSYTKMGQKHNEDVAFIIMEMPDKCSAQISLSWIQPGVKERLVTVTGTTGTLVIDTFMQKLFILKGSETESISVTKNNTIMEMVSHFVNCIYRVENPINSSLVGAITVGVLSSARKSLTERKALRILE